MRTKLDRTIEREILMHRTLGIITTVAGGLMGLSGLGISLLEMGTFNDVKPDLLPTLGSVILAETAAIIASSRGFYRMVTARNYVVAREIRKRERY